MHDILAETGITILAGPPKIGKTAFASAIALNVAKTTGPVLWLALEESRRERGEVMQAARGLPRLHFYITYNRIQPGTRKGIATLWNLTALIQPAPSSSTRSSPPSHPAQTSPSSPTSEASAGKPAQTP